MACRVYVIGMGMGNPGTLTRDALDALNKSELIVGSQRLLDALGDYDVPKVAHISPAAIAQELERTNARVASVVMSGDIGFYSGATGLYEHLDRLGLEVCAISGISSLQYLCAKLHTPWQDVCVVSAHGREHNAVGAIQAHPKTFALLGGKATAEGMCAQLVERGLGHVWVHVGERLSYEDERITSGTAHELCGRSFAQPSVLLANNPRPIHQEVSTPHLSDDDFVRSKVPMTKEEVRALAICKLRIARDHTVWDVGAGTGSISAEAARVACEGRVFAIEKNDEAVGLISRNKEAFGLTNLRVVEGMAPQALEGLPAPDRVFVGGTCGNLRPILRAALAANPALRLCIAAVTLETLGEALECARELDLQRVDIAQVSVAKACQAGAYHLMRANNPVYLMSADGSAPSEMAPQPQPPCIQTPAYATAGSEA